jgi:hypothetical protein
VPNEELIVASGCAHDSFPATPQPGRKRHDEPHCGLVVARVLSGTAQVIAHFDALAAPEVAQFGTAPHLRAKALDAKGGFTREITYVYGRVELAEAKR